jgi:uncharacterized protein YbgA (DUF1722 family)/uncharacterized protein YbbK (DUF523 family)
LTTDHPRIGVSSCLLGNNVRFDGQHKRDPFLVDALGPFVDFVPVCPEVEVGMTTPRETLRLIRIGSARAGNTRMVGTKSDEDWTARMTTYADRRVKALADDHLSGYVLKKDSPSCGLMRVKVYLPDQPVQQPERNGQGLFAAALQRAFPDLPIEEEGRLNDPHLRDNFIERVFAYGRLQALWASRWTLRTLIEFHTRNKMALLAHDEPQYRRLGRLVAVGKTLPRTELRDRYQTAFMAGLTTPATPGRHANVLSHMFGHFSDALTPNARAETTAVIQDHQRGLIPLIVPLTLIRHYVRVLDVTYLADQTYLDPHPKELMLRNHV